MTSSDIHEEKDNQGVLKWVADAGINGLGVLPPARNVARDHLGKSASLEDAIDSIIAWRTTWAVGTGFLTGLGGVATLPIALPASLAASYALGANTVAAVAHLRGYELDSEPVRTMILLCLLGKAGEEYLKCAGIQVGTRVCRNLIQKIPGRVLVEINKKVGFRLITKSGEKGVVNLMKLVPLVGGVVGGSLDGLFVNTCGKTAKSIFSPDFV